MASLPSWRSKRRVFRRRNGSAGEPVLLLDQDRARWDQLLIRRGLAALDARNHSSQHIQAPPGPYRCRRAVAACHARARKP